MTTVYLVLGALSFWAIVIVAAFVGSVAVAEWWHGRQFVKDIGRVERLTAEQTDRLIREWKRTSA